MDFKQFFKLFIHRISVSFCELSKSSTFHGFPSFIRSKRKLMKLMWFILYISALNLSAYMVMLTIVDYFKFQVNTDLTIVYENPSEFPTVSFCNLNPPKRKYQSFSDLKIKSIFDGKEAEVIAYDEPLFGTCFSFNSNKSDLKQSIMPGKHYGFTVELFADYSDNYMPSWNEPFVKKLKRPQLAPFEPPGFIENGFRIFIHESQYKPRPAEGIDIPNGFKTNIVISKQSLVKLGSPYSKCKTNTDLELLKNDTTFNDTYFKASIPANGFYSQNRCLDACFLGMIDQPNYDKPYDERPIRPARMKNMTERNNYENCLLFCPEQCDSLSYTVSISLSDFPSESYLNTRLLRNRNLRNILEKSDYWIKMNGSTNYSDLKSRLISFNIYFDDLKYVKISHSPKLDEINLMSNIGGILGVCIGISFLSLFEIVEFVYEAFWITFAILIEKNQSTIN